MVDISDDGSGAIGGTIPAEPTKAAPINNPPQSVPIPPTGNGFPALKIGTLLGAAALLSVGVWGIAQLGGESKRAAYIFAFIVLLSAAMLNIDKLTTQLRSFGVAPQGGK